MRARVRTSTAASAFLLLVFGVAVGSCGSAPVARSEQGSTSDATAAAAPAPTPAPASIQSLDLREEAPGVAVLVSGDRPLVWTSYRDAEGRLVVELPNSAPAAEVTGLTASTGLVAGVEVASDATGERPLTRLTLTTRGEAEHSLAAENGHLVLRLVPAGSAPSTVAAAAAPAAPAASEPMSPEPAPRASAPAPVATVAAAPMPPLGGTPDNPVSGPAPSGRLATVLGDVAVVAGASELTIAVRGDGALAWSSFVLQEPPRFVLDLPGVTNGSGTSSIAVDAGAVQRVRVAQFRVAPDPVTRVVFDLSLATVPTVERQGESLIVRFGEGVAAAPAAPIESAPAVAQAAPAPEAPPPTPVAEPTLAETATAGAPLTQPAEAPPVEVAADMTPPADEPMAEPMTEQVAEAAPVAPEPEPAYVAPPPVAPVAPTLAEAPPAPAPVRRPPPPPAPAAVGTTDIALVEAAAVPVSAEPTAQRDVVLQSFREKTAGNSGEKKYVGEPISMELKDADIKDVLRTFAKISGLNIVVQPGVRGSVTVQLENVPWDQALEQVLKINGLGMELEGNILRIAPIARLQKEAADAQALKSAQALSIPLQTVMKRISYAKATDLQRVLRAVMSQRGSIAFDPRTNTMILKELPSYMPTVLSVIETLDSPEPQVMIEARIVETTKRFTRTLGIRWGFQGEATPQSGNSTGIQFPNSVEADGAVNLLTGGSNGLLNLSLGNILDTFSLNARLQAAEAEGLINVLSAPKVTTLNNEQASIQSGLQIPVQTVANNTVSVQFVNATLRLNVTPQVTAEGTVLMDLNIQKRNPELAFAVAGATNAPINTKEARTRVIVRDGGTTVIGGIFEVGDDQGQDRVPGLANVPIIGHLFKNKRRTDENKELIIFVTPRVVRL